MNSPTKNSILIVDDEPQDIVFLDHVLGGEYLLYAARDGEEGVVIKSCGVKGKKQRRLLVHPAWYMRLFQMNSTSFSPHLQQQNNLSSQENNQQKQPYFLCLK